MYALPGPALEQAAQDYRVLALHAATAHFSYLTIGQHLLQELPPVIPEDDTAYAMLDQITEMTGVSGMQRYEVSAYQTRAPVFSQPQLLAVW
jgi:oxygen-independent coproporphyrinogen-3 oxidase